ncbi:EAL domain-containing protein [Sulfurimonas sp.]|uniref:EAL domain-containing protein n=1 Tax=Sulfurimonas sp. TaxID=2022749 RepID=UPI003563F9D7
MPFKYNTSIYLTLALTIMFTVMLVLAVHTRASYVELKSKAVVEMKKNSSKTIELLTKNISDDIESYAVNDYDKIVGNEMKLSQHLAIIVKDYNMGEILGSKVYISGKIRKSTNIIVDYDQNNLEHTELVRKAFFKQSKDILSSHGKVIGNITVYISDRYLQSKLNELIKDSILEFFLIGTVLAIALFITMYLFIVKPISDISYILTKQDEDGIPTDPLSLNGPKEVSRLAQTINYMLDSIKKSRLKIDMQNKELINERDRFELAVDGTQDGLWDWDMQNDIVTFSDRFYEMLGYEKNEIIQTAEGWNKLVHPEDLKDSNQVLRDYLNDQGRYKYENTFRMLTKDGEYIWITSRGKALFNDDGTPVRFVGFITDITSQVLHNEELDYTAKHDMLTDLPNRFLFTEYIQTLLNNTQENKTHMALLYIDLDGFKEINDEFGHVIGDSILIHVAQKIKNILRKEDFVARLGGDEFIVAVSNLESTNNVVPMLNKFLDTIRQKVENPKDKNESLHMTASIGVTFYPQNKEIGPEALLRQADQAMYDAKNLGKNQYHIFNIDSDMANKEHLHIIQDFEQSLISNDFILYYQPKVDMRTNKIYGFETLLRWQHPTKGLLFPDEFLPYVNPQKELMLNLGEWVISNAFAQFSKWKEAGYDFDLSINISAHEFKETKTFALLKSLLKQYPNISPKDVEFEILETHAFDDISQANKMISTFQELGFNIALDDFGTGYSTLTYLKDLSVNTLKIDKSFVMDMLHDRASLSILEATIALAEAFRCDVIAEGVESVEHGNVLIQLGCYKAQGYVLSKPMPSYEVETWLTSFQGHDIWEQNSKKLFHEHSSLYAIVEHKQWVKNLQEHIKNPDIYPTIPELDDHRCNFHEWLYNDAKKHFSKKVIEKIDNMHVKLHAEARNALSAHGKKREELLNEMLNTHKEIIETIQSQNSM